MMSGTPTPINPFNDRPTVGLFDHNGVLLNHVSQREAARRLRAGLADLVLDVPPGVRLTSAAAENQAPTAGSAATEVHGEFLHARRGQLYGNVTFQGPGGEVMFHGDAEKALWYLNRELVEVVSHEPPVLRFRFAPGGAGHAGDAFYLGGLQNRCVVCGANEGLNRHHIVPSEYRRHLPTAVKEHSHHDVVLLCLACHEQYERSADALKAELGRACGVPPHGLRGERDRERSRAIVFARTLRQAGEKIPPARREEMLQVIGAWAGQGPLQEADIAAIARLDPRSEEGAIEHGQQVVAGLADVQAFVRRWHEHFLRVMEPRFLSEHWDIDRPASRAGRGLE